MLICLPYILLTILLGFLLFLALKTTTTASEEQMNTSTTPRNQLPPVPEDYYNE